jgi:hypothetical protein
MTASRQRRHRSGFVLLFASLALTASLGAAELNLLEAKVKAAYLFNLTRFVDWPAQPTDAMRICVLGNDTIGSMLRELPDARVKELPLQIELDAAASPGNCQVLFIGAAFADWQPLLAQLEGSSVLTVSDRADFARNGGIVGFYLDQARVKLEINTNAARTAKLRISSNLLELARKVP